MMVNPERFRNMASECRLEAEVPSWLGDDACFDVTCRYCDLIAVFTSQPAMINYPGKDRENDDIWITNTKRAPKEGTVVKIIIKPHQP